MGRVKGREDVGLALQPLEARATDAIEPILLTGDHKAGFLVTFAP